MNWITSNIIDHLSDLISGFIDMLGGVLDNVFYWLVELANANPYIVNAKKFIVITALSLITLMVIKIVISGYLLETDYDSDEDPFNLLVKIAEATAVIMNAGWIFDFFLLFSKDFTSDLTGNMEAEGYYGQTLSLLGMDMSSLKSKALAWVIMLLIMLIAMIVFTVVAGLRGAELIAMNLFMPFFAIDLLTNSRERWNNFFSAFVLAFFTYSFQILFFIVALKCYSSVSLTNAIYFVPAIVWMIMAITSPKFLEKYLYKTGVSNAASSGVRMVVQNAAMRGMMKR